MTPPRPPRRATRARRRARRPRRAGLVRRAGRWRPAALGVPAFAALLAPAVAAADRYEATIAVRPLAGLASVAEDGAPARAAVPAAGLAGSLAWGLRNDLDVAVVATAASLGQASFDEVAVQLAGTPHAATAVRTTRVATLQAAATLRLGVAWVPTLTVALGLGARQRSALLVTREGDAPIGLVADGAGGGASLDLVARLAVGLERRLTRRWSLGVAAEAAHHQGLGAPALDVVGASLSAAYTWYPLW